MPDHPELDLLGVLMDVSSDEEDTHPRSLLEEERERKRKERNKLKMVGIALSVTAVPTVKQVAKLQAPLVPIENLEQQIKLEAENTGKGAIWFAADSNISNNFIDPVSNARLYNMKYGWKWGKELKTSGVTQISKSNPVCDSFKEVSPLPHFSVSFFDLRQKSGTDFMNNLTLFEIDSRVD